jgi:N-acetylglucosamine kinase-like BadF-type ATPase
MSESALVVVGVDGGGTKTDVVVADLDGRTLGTAQAGPTNWESVGTDRMVAEVGRGIDAALGAAGARRHEVAAAAFGLAGVDWASDHDRVDAALARLGLPGPRVVANDSLVALRAGCSRPWGIVSSVGTGTVTAGVDPDGRWFRTLAVGWGEPTGAGTLVSEALHAIAAHYHRTAPASSLTERFLDATGHVDVAALFEDLTRGRAPVGAHLAPLLDEAARAGDAVARQIIDDTARRHAAMVVGVAAHLDMTDLDFELVTAGSVHRTGHEYFGPAFLARVHETCPHARPTMLEVSAALGAVRLALDALAGEVSSETPRHGDPVPG